MSAKAREMLLAWAPDIPAQDISVTPSGVNGPDLTLSARAQEIYPFSFEMKNCEKLNVWEALKQAEGHAKHHEVPLLVFARNQTEPYVALKLEVFLRLIR